MNRLVPPLERHRIKWNSAAPRPYTKSTYDLSAEFAIDARPGEPGQTSHRFQKTNCYSLSLFSWPFTLPKIQEISKIAIFFIPITGI